MSWDVAFWFVVGAVGYRGAAVVLAQARPARVAPPPERDRVPDCWQANARQRIARPRR